MVVSLYSVHLDLDREDVQVVSGHLRGVVYPTIIYRQGKSASLTMNEILSNNISEKCLRSKGIVFMSYIIKILFSGSVDFTAQYRIEHRSFHQCAILAYVY